MQTRRAVLRRFLVTVPLLAGGGSALMLAGCGGGNGNGNTPGIETPNTRQRGKYGPLAFTLDLPNLDYALEEMVEWTLTVQNISDRRIVLVGDSPIVSSRIGPKGFQVLSSEELVDAPQFIALMPNEKLSLVTRLDPVTVSPYFLQYDYGKGTTSITAWLRVGRIGDELVPDWPWAVSSLVEQPTMIYLQQDINVL